MKLIGITNISFDQDFIRNQFFLFDELTVLNMETALSLGGDYSKARKRTESELEYLSNKGLVTRVRPIEHLIEEKVLPEDIVARFNGFSRDSDTWRDFVSLVCSSEDLWQRYSFGFCKSEKEAVQTINEAIALQLRAHTLMANISNLRQFAFCSDGSFRHTGDHTPRTIMTITSIVLNQIPIIPDMPYDEVIDFKASQTVRRLYDRLKLWIAQTSMKEQEAKLACAEVEQAIHEYREFTNRQASKRRLLQIELVCKIPLEIVESLLRLAPSRAVGALLELRRKQIDLYESELKAPGNQFAYIREIEQRLAGRHATSRENHHRNP